MTSTNIDYIHIYFEFPELTKIHGTPSYHTLRIIEDEVKSNLASVTSELGGGANGHLGLLGTDAEYANIPGTAPYIRPVHPGALVIEAGTSQHISTGMRNDHGDAIKLFREVDDVEKCIIKQLVQALDSKFLKSLRNRSTNAIAHNLQTIFAHLFTKYGTIEDEVLTEEEEKLRDTEYNILDPLVTVFDQIEELQHLGNAAQNPYSEAQLIKLALRIIKGTNDFETGIRTWIEKARVDKTWVSFKSHFEEAHRTLRSVRGHTMQSASFHHVNLLK